MKFDKLHNLFDYVNGNLFWKVKPRKGIKIGSIAGSIHKNGYRYIVIDKKQYAAHRLIFAMHFGYLPCEIDHIDGNKSNNAIGNLREAKRPENCFNVSLKKSNTSGVKNVSFDKNTQKWDVRLGVFGKRIFFGRFETLEEAKLIAEKARNEHHGKFANNG